MTTDFDQALPREHTNSVKFDARETVFGTEDVIPMWVADMDFAVPEAISQALLERAGHPVFGYSLFPDSLYEVMIRWFRTRHDWAIQRDWILMAPGVVPSLHAAAMAFAGPGDGIIIQTPVYPPFLSAVEKTGRRLIENPLVLEDGYYRMDLEHLERCAADASVMFLCSPHNPVGRVWERNELEAVLAIARRHGLTVISDDVHCDLIYPGAKHIMLAGLTTAHDKLVTAVAPSKTFNIAGLGLSALVMSDPAQRQALKQVFESLHMEQTNPFSAAAFEAAYRDGGPWLDELMMYLQDNYRFVRDYLRDQVPEIKLIESDGTYLLWLDCRKLGLSNAELKAFFIQRAKVGMNSGASFGEGGGGFMRMNIGTRRAVLAQALDQIRDAVNALR
ncbi:MAG: PatB family C-S lyase [Marinobacter sp.]|uniref:MalY/PatB family protein n=1 Tax=Marinobacter sp. TaxID=50741 RepID=UPI0034A04F35